MKKTITLTLLIFAFIGPNFGQRINIDSIIKVVIARNPRKASNVVVNADSLFRLLPATKPGATRVDLIYKIFDPFGKAKQNVEMGYRILAWSKSHHDQISEAVIASELGTVLYSNGDKATGSQLETEALVPAKASGDNQALGIVYQNSFARADYTDSQMKYYALKAFKYSMAANDVVRVSWDYMDLASYYDQIKKPDSAIYYFAKSLDWAIRANSIPDICTNLCQLGYYQKDDRLKEKYFRAAFNIAQHINNAAALSSSAVMLSRYYAGKNNIDTSLVYARIAQQTSRQLTLSFGIDPARMLSGLYFKKRNIDSLTKYTAIYYKLREQVANNEGLIRAQAATFAEQQKQQQAEVQKKAAKTAQQLWLLGIAILFLLLIAFIFWRNNRQTRKANALLAQQKHQTELTLAELKAAQVQLIQSEKMASLGELTAGIAHEIQNPLNFVNNFSEVNREMIDEMEEEIKAGNITEALSIADDIRQNEEKISHHGKRADFIVKGMLQHSRTSTGEKQPTNINTLADEFLRLSYHGLRAKDKTFNADLVTNFDQTLPKVNIAQQDIGRVLLNLFNNAFYAVKEKQQTAGPDYKPTVTVTTFAPASGGWAITVKDNGTGIPDAIREKIMQPFFTTKPTGQGTGLGLSLSYDIIVKGHNGQLTVVSEDGEYTEFTVTAPV
jgi:two-component system NtrC family sensor kinase